MQSFKSILLLVTLSYGCVSCDIAPSKQIIVVKADGTPAAGANIYFTFESSDKTVDFKTGADGKADVKPPKGFHSITVVLDHKKAGIFAENVKWPLKVSLPAK